jgi:hypothetical protein
MKKLSVLGIIGGAAFLTAAPFSLNGRRAGLGEGSETTRVHHPPRPRGGRLHWPTK